MSVAKALQTSNQHRKWTGLGKAVWMLCEGSCEISVRLCRKWVWAKIFHFGRIMGGEWCLSFPAHQLILLILLSNKIDGTSSFCFCLFSLPRESVKNWRKKRGEKKDRPLRSGVPEFLSGLILCARKPRRALGNNYPSQSSCLLGSNRNRTRLQKYIHLHHINWISIAWFFFLHLLEF